MIKCDCTVNFLGPKNICLGTKINFYYHYQESYCVFLRLICHPAIFLRNITAVKTVLCNSMVPMMNQVE